MTTVFYDDQGRPEPPLSASEVQTLLGFLDFQRATLQWRTSGLDTGALRRRLDGHPSEMTLGGLLKHLAYVEFHWFEECSLAEPTSEPWVCVDWSEDEDWDWHSAAQDTSEELHALWERAVDRSRQIVVRLMAEAEDDDDALAATHDAWGGRAQVSLRWILTHMIEEYARHNGHADLLREQIDGQTGE
ncbi:DinB family protein [Micrococcaceae bacterium Sec6.3]